MKQKKQGPAAWLLTVLSLVAIGLLGACMPVQPEGKAASSSPATEATGALEGVVTYKERIALPAGAVVDVRLLDMGADPFAIVSEQQITTAGEQVPIPFLLTYDPAAIDPVGVYAVSARILIDGAPAFVATEPTPVLSAGAVSTGLEIVLYANPEPGSTAPVEDTAAWTISGTLTEGSAATLPDGAVVEVALRDMAGENFPIIASDTYTTSGQQFPLDFGLAYMPDMVSTDGVYALTARVLIDGQPMYVTMEPTPVKPAPALEDVTLMLTDNSEMLAPAAGGAATDSGATGGTADTAAAAVTGVVTYRQRVALPAGAVVTVRLQDISRQDVAATLISEQVITTTGEQVPIGFVLPYDPAQVDPRAMYAVSARIEIDGALRWISDTIVPVLSRDNPTSGVEVIVVPVN